MTVFAAGELRLDLNLLDYALLASYFAVVLGIGFFARRSVSSSIDFFLSGRSLPAWVTGLAFVSANMGALEILGMAANGAQFGMPTTHYYWIGAVPAMVFLGVVMMPFYYGAKLHSVPEYIRRRFNAQAHVFNAATFAIGTILIAGVNLFALALVMQAMLGWSIPFSIVVAAVIVLAYTFLGGLTAAVYNEVLQFFVIFAALIPLTLLGLHHVGGWQGLMDGIETSKLGEVGTNAWSGIGIGDSTDQNPLGNWLGIVFGLGFVLSFGYWTTSFAEVQRALSAKNMSAARRTPLIAAFPKMLLLPAVVIIPGMVATLMIPGLGGSGDLQYNNAIPLLMNELLPNGVLGLAVTGLLASFMAGMAANISAFNTVVTYDLWQPYVVKGREDHYYLQTGRWVTVAGTVIAIGTAFIASGYTNIMDYFQALASIFNAPLFATFVLGLFWTRMTPWAGFWGLAMGTLAAFVVWLLNETETISFASSQGASFWGAIAAFGVDAIVSVAVTFVTPSKPVEELRGLVWSQTPRSARSPHEPGDTGWYRSPPVLGGIVLAVLVGLNVAFG